MLSVITRTHKLCKCQGRRSFKVYGFAISYRHIVCVITELQTGVLAHRLEHTQDVKPVYVSKGAATLQLRM